MTALGAGLLVALGLDELKHLRRPSSGRWLALAGAGLVAIVPTPHFAASASPLFSAFYDSFSCPQASGRSWPPIFGLVPPILLSCSSFPS